MTRVSVRRLLLVVSVVAAQLLLATATVAAESSTAKADYIVVLRDDVNVRDKTESLERSHGFRSRFVYTTALRGFAATLTVGQANVISKLPFVRGVVPDQVATISDTEAMASGDSAPSGVRRIGGATSVVVHTPAGVNVAVIDTGIDLSHPDLNAVSGTNCVTPGTPAIDDHGHGTHVAGTIGARNNGIGVVGVAPGTRIYAVKVLNAQGSGSFAAIACGIDWVAANAASLNIKVANMSLGGASSGSYTCGVFFGIVVDAMHQAICNATNAGVTFVVAAGNNGASQADYAPAKYPQVLTVTAVGDTDGVGGAAGAPPSCRSGEADDRYASFSNFATSTAQQNHTIAAPGVCVNSTTMGGGYASNWSGTSMASPHAAGATALCIRSGATNGPCAGLTPAQVILKMRELALARTNAVPSHGFTGVAGQYYGNMVWIGQDLGGGTTPTPDFSLSSSPTTRTITQGQATSYAITVNPTGGFGGSVQLSTSALPSGVSGSFTTNPTTGSSTLNVTATASAATGTTNVTVTGVSGGLTRTVQVSLTVNAAATPDFTLSSDPTSRTITQGQATSYAITVNPTGGFGGSVQLSTSALPSGVSGTFTTNPTTGSSTLNVTATASAATGTTNVTVTGVSGGLTRTVQVSLTVNAGATGNPDFTLTASPTSQSTPRGTAVNYTITVNPAGGFGSAVSFSVSGLGLGMNGSFTPTSSTTSSTLRVTSNSFWSPRGTRTLTITGTSGGISRTVQVQLTLT